MKKNLALKVNTPAFVADAGILTANYQDFSGCAPLFPGGLTAGISVKTNPCLHTLRLLKQCGAMAEVVSPREWQLALKAGFAPRQIIYNGPCKDRETFLEAVSGGSIVNIDSVNEIEWLENLHPQGAVVGIRLNISLPENPGAPGVTDTSRFGFSCENGELQKAIARIENAGAVVVGLHIHRSTSRRHTDYYRRSVRYALAAAGKCGLSQQLEYVDIGGGFSAPLPGKPTFRAYAQAVADTLREAGMERLHVIAEPGNAVFATAFSYVCTVIDTKAVGEDTVFVTTDGSRNDIDATLRANDWKRTVIAGPGNPVLDARERVGWQYLCGCTCMEQDRILEFAARPRLMRNDRIIILHAGAYTLTLAPDFIKPRAKVYILENGLLTQAPE